MSSLAEIVGRVVDACQTPDGSIVTADAVTMALPLVKEDAEACDTLLCEALSKRIKDAATRARAAAMDADGRQPSFWGDKLRPRYALDIEGRSLKNTNSLTRLEFERIRQIRRDQLAADAAALAVLDEAATALSPIWDLNPALSFGEVMQVYLSIRSAAD